MAKQSPLMNAQPNAVSVCGKLLTKGQAVTVPESAIGPKEKKAHARGRISVRPSNMTGFVQVVCTL